MKENETQTDETLPALDADNRNVADTARPQEQTQSGDTEETIPPKHDANDDDADDGKIAKLVADAEQRGYMRGLNERLSQQMNQPGLYEDLARKAAGQPAKNAADDDPLTSRFLSAVRASVWD